MAGSYTGKDRPQPDAEKDARHSQPITLVVSVMVRRQDGGKLGPIEAAKLRERLERRLCDQLNHQHHDTSGEDYFLDCK